MNGRNRADLGFGDALEDFDPESWPVEPARPAPPAPLREETRRRAESLGFRSREAAAPQPAPAAAPMPPAGQGVAQPARPPRRRRTGRNAQFNLKARPETIEAYCRIADQNGWGLGETLEQAVALLQERYGQERQG